MKVVMCVEKLPAEGRKVSTREYLILPEDIVIFQPASANECLVYVPAVNKGRKLIFTLVTLQRGRNISAARADAGCSAHCQSGGQDGKQMNGCAGAR